MNAYENNKKELMRGHKEIRNKLEVEIEQLKIKLHRLAQDAKEDSLKSNNQIL